MTAPTIAPVDSLDAQARAQQAQNAAKVSQAVLAYWLMNVDAQRISATAGGWLDFSVATILRGYERGFEIAAAYAQAVQRLQLPGAPLVTVPHPQPPSIEQIRRSLAFTGPGKLAVDLQKIPGELPPDPNDPQGAERLRRQQQSAAEMRETARRAAGASAAGSAYKYTTAGGRDTVDEMVKTKVAVGYVRITKEHPCAFCLMLASRGPVYAEDSFEESDARFTGPGNQKAHDNCGCGLRPLYTRDENHWPGQARQADELWQEMLRTKGPRDDPANAFAKLVRERGIADLSRY